MTTLTETSEGRKYSASPDDGHCAKPSTSAADMRLNASTMLSPIPGDAPMTTPATKYRLLTRSDMDGLVCAVLLKELGILGEIEFHHPKDVQDGKISVTDRDILTNLPYVCKRPVTASSG